MQKVDSTHLHSQINQYRPLVELLKKEVANVVVGNEHIIEAITIAMLCNGHILLEGVPGVAKTTMVKAFSDALGLDFKRIQFTPDLLPADLIGTLIYNPKTHEFETKKGPLFSNLILADEINRAPSKVQSALLEAMQEQQVTIGSTTYKLDQPFLVFATQNPIEQEGTYNLPEAQVDRFLFKVLIDYPSKSDEISIIKKSIGQKSVNSVVDKKTITAMQQMIQQIHVDDKIVHYIVDIVSATRNAQSSDNPTLKQYIQFGVSPRAGLALHHAAQARAFLENREFVIPDDVKAVAYSCLRHRILLSYEALTDNITADEIVHAILKSTATP